MAANPNAIQECAYYLWQQAGEPSGEELRFWLAAEQEYACYGDMNSEDAELGKGPDETCPSGGDKPTPQSQPAHIGFRG